MTCWVFTGDGWQTKLPRPPVFGAQAPKELVVVLPLKKPCGGRCCSWSCPMVSVEESRMMPARFSMSRIGSMRPITLRSSKRFAVLGRDRGGWIAQTFFLHQKVSPMLFGVSATVPDLTISKGPQSYPFSRRFLRCAQYVPHAPRQHIHLNLFLSIRN